MAGYSITVTEVGAKSCALKLAYLKTIQAIFKIVELIIATALISTVLYYINDGQRVSGDLFFLLIIVTFFICTACLLLSQWIVWSEVKSNSKSMFEIVFFAVSIILLLSSTINLFSNAVGRSKHGIYLAYVIISILEFLLIGLYTTDIVLSLCLNCCRKKRETQTEVSN